MQHYRWMVVGLLLSGVAMLQAGETQSTSPARLNVKLGLWEMMMQPQMSGDTNALMGQQPEGLSPDERAKRQAMMQALLSNMQKPHYSRECMTQEKLARGFGTNHDDTNCKSAVVTNTATDYEANLQCAGQDGNRTVNMHISAPSSEHVTGTVRTDVSRSGKDMNVNAKIEGKWLSADCGTVKDSEPESGPQ
jgi:Protein of unknown function (DUF3617)